jgi:hypothetical protein
MMGWGSVVVIVLGEECKVLAERRAKQIHAAYASARYRDTSHDRRGCLGDRDGVHV